MIHNVKKTPQNRLLLWSVVLTFTSLVSMAQAQEFVEYRVVNVRTGSALNVRAEHNSASADIGSASPGAKMYVTGYSPDKKWAKVKWDDGFGWVAMSFLSLAKPSDDTVQALAKLQASQANPTFSKQQLAAAQAPVTLAKATPASPQLPTASSAADVPQVAALVDMEASSVDSSNNPNISCVGNNPSWNLTMDSQGALVFQAPDRNSLYATSQWRQAINNKNTYAFAVSDIKGTLLKQSCDDAYSDQRYDWQLQLQTNGFGGSEQLSGCCTTQ